MKLIFWPWVYVVALEKLVLELHVLEVVTTYWNVVGVFVAVALTVLLLLHAGDELGHVTDITGFGVFTVKLYTAAFVVSPSVKLKIQFPDWLLTPLSTVITNWFPFNVQVAKEQETKVGVIVSQLPAVAHISETTFDIVFDEVIVHKFFGVFGTFKTASFQWKLTDALVTFPAQSFTVTQVSNSPVPSEYNV